MPTHRAIGRAAGADFGELHGAASTRGWRVRSVVERHRSNIHAAVLKVASGQLRFPGLSTQAVLLVAQNRDSFIREGVSRGYFAARPLRTTGAIVHTPTRVCDEMRLRGAPNAVTGG